MCLFSSAIWFCSTINRESTLSLGCVKFWRKRSTLSAAWWCITVLLWQVRILSLPRALVYRLWYGDKISIPLQLPRPNPSPLPGCSGKRMQYLQIPLKEYYYTTTMGTVQAISSGRKHSMFCQDWLLDVNAENQMDKVWSALKGTTPSYQQKFLSLMTAVYPMSHLLIELLPLSQWDLHSS